MHLFGDYFDYYSHNMTSMYLGTMVLFCGKGRLSVYLPSTKLRQLLVREYFVASICSLKNISAKFRVGDSGNRELCCPSGKGITKIFEGRNSFLLFESPPKIIQSWCSQAVCDALPPVVSCSSCTVVFGTLPTASVLPTRYFLLCSHPTLLPPLGPTHHKISHRQKFRVGPVLTACTSVRLVYTGACEGLGRMGTLRKMWRV